MEVNQIKMELAQVEHVIDRAAQAVQDDEASPQELKDCVKQLDVQTRKARLSRDADDLLQYIDEMEETSDRAKIACEKTNDLGTEARAAVMQAHRRLSDLRYNLH